MKSINEYASVIAYNMGLNLKEKNPGFALDESKKVGVSYRETKNYKYARFLNIDGKNNKPFIYLHEDDIRHVIIITSVNSDKEKTDSLQIYNFSGHDISVYIKNCLEFVLYIHDTDFIIKDKDDNEKIICSNKFNIQDVINEINDRVIKMDNLEEWEKTASKILNPIMPAIIMMLTETEEIIINRRIKNELDEQEETSIHSKK